MLQQIEEVLQRVLIMVLDGVLQPEIILGLEGQQLPFVEVQL